MDNEPPKIGAPFVVRYEGYLNKPTLSGIDGGHVLHPEITCTGLTLGSGSGWLSGTGDFRLGICNDNTCTNPTGYFQYGLYFDFATKTLGGNGSSMVPL